jgi:hypothetical protein
MTFNFFIYLGREDWRHNVLITQLQCDTLHIHQSKWGWKVLSTDEIMWQQKNSHNRADVQPQGLKSETQRCFLVVSFAKVQKPVTTNPWLWSGQCLNHKSDTCSNTDGQGKIYFCRRVCVSKSGKPAQGQKAPTLRGGDYEKPMRTWHKHSCAQW